MVKNTNKARSQKLNTWFTVLVTLGVVVVANLLSEFVFYRIDLTEDERFTLGEQTTKLLEDLDDVVYVQCYLDGDLPSGFEQLKTSVREMLNEFSVKSDGKIEYEFIDPYTIAEGQERSDLFVQLQNRGLKSFELEDMREDEIVHKIVWPAAFVRIGEKEVPVSFLRDQMGMSPDLVLHNSMMGVEYELSNAIASLKQVRKKKVAFVVGHGELSGARTADIGREISLKYDVERVDITQYKVGKLEEYDAIIIAQPDTAFAEVDKYKIDQYLVKGGKVLWFLESLIASMDSLKAQPYTTTLDYDLNLRDMLFKYGVRVNLDLVQDYNSHEIPVYAGKGTNNANFRKWPYFPLVAPTTEHPIVKNLGLTWFQFANSIDTLPSPGIKKTVLLKSSPNSRIVHHPHRITLQLAQINLDPSLFAKGEQALAVLLEGSFTSFFKNRLAPTTLNDPNYGSFQEEGAPTKMIVVSDGDVIGNPINPVNGQMYALGYDRFTGKSFANKAFVMNCLDFLLDDYGLFQLRSKEFKLRMLQQGAVREQKVFWQGLNLVLPVIILILAGAIYVFIRKRRFTK
ncbi:MAG: gliding motility-associated ABC transporter substrate-binding protein GldG [Bacteroidia bacterium]